MTDQQNKRNEIEQRLMFQQGRMSRTVIGQIMELIDALVVEAGCGDNCKCTTAEPQKHAPYEA